MKKYITLIAIFIFVGTKAQAQAAATTLATGGVGVGTASTTTAVGNSALSSGFQKTCTGSAMGAISCTYMVLAAAQAVMDMLGKDNGTAVTAATTDSTTGASTLPTTTTADGGLASKLQQAEADALTTAAGKGVTLSSDLGSVTLPNGSTVPTSSLNSTDGLEAAGLTGDEAAQVLADAAALAAKVKSQYSVASMATSDGGGGALNRGSNGGSDDGDSKLKSFLSAFNKGSRKPASMSGLSKKLGNTGESIGVAGDDIFQMVTRQYQKKDNQNTFLKTP